jgi:hypothetical protein
MRQTPLKEVRHMLTQVHIEFFSTLANRDCNRTVCRHALVFELLACSICKQPDPAPLSERPEEI